MDEGTAGTTQNVGAAPTMTHDIDVGIAPQDSFFVNNAY
jgi:hypothetical protein